MGLLIMAESIFIEKDQDKKWAAVEDHYSVAYHMKFKEKPSPEIIDRLYRELQKLRDTEFYYGKKPKEPQNLK